MHLLKLKGVIKLFLNCRTNLKKSIIHKSCLRIVFSFNNGKILIQCTIYDHATASCAIKHTGHAHCFPFSLVITSLIYMVISEGLLIELLTSSGDKEQNPS